LSALLKNTTLLAVGDIMLGDSPVCYGFGVGSMIEKYGSNYPFQHIAEELNKGDIVIGNLEVVISAFNKQIDNFESIQFRGQPEAIHGLVESNFNIVALASNHTMQHGRKGLEETIDILNENNIGFTGIEIPEKQVRNQYFMEKNGLKFCFLGYNFRPQQYFKDPPLWNKPSLELIKDEICKVRDLADCVVITLHWGDEFIEYPSYQQVNLARQLIDSGANIILGHHPHIIQGVEKYNGGVIAYSLGNFIFDMWQKRLRKTMILKCIISKKAEIDFQIIPIEINNKYQPQIVHGQAGEILKQELEKLSLKISNNSTDNDNYNSELNKNTKLFRREIYLHYLYHLHKYGVRPLIGNLLNAMKKRLIK